MSDLFSATYNPDVLSCLANLSNDEVFTPPEVVNQMLDMLPKEIWSDKNATFLDPACKSGVFLREIAKRLIEAQLPNYEQISYEINEKLRAGGELDGRDIAFQNMLEDVIEHVFKNQVFGIAITELTSLLSRRSVYCSKYPQSDYSVVRFDNPEGRIDYKLMQHTWRNGKCVFCGASEVDYNREEHKEQYAYEFIHLDNPEEVFNMKFDVIIGNPPYQLSTGQGQSQAKPIYQEFIQQAIKMNPHYLVMITPSRWLNGGMGLSKFRSSMLKDKRMKKMVDHTLSTDLFPGVDIAGGVNYFLWDRGANGNCEYTYVDGAYSEKTVRQFDEFDVFVRDTRALTIIHKVLEKGEESIASIMSSLGPFGLGTAERGQKNRDRNCYKLLSSAGFSYIDKTKVTNGEEYINKWKVVVGKATSAGAATANSEGQRKVIATLGLLQPNAVCTFSYFIGGAFLDENEAKNCEQYLSSKFARYLLLQTLSGININKDKFRFVPIQDFRETWDDEKLFEKYGLDDNERDLIERSISDMECGLDHA